MATPRVPYHDTVSHYPTNDTKTSPETPYFLPSTTYQPPSHSPAEPIPMLDSTPVPRNTSRSPRFHEHISELADTSSPTPVPSFNTTTKRWGSVLYTDRDSTTLGNPQTEAILPSQDSRMDEARVRQQQLHLMSWNNYDDARAAELQGGGVGATIGRGEVQQGGNRSVKKQGEVSPDESDSPLDRKFIVSPMGTLDRARN